MEKNVLLENNEKHGLSKWSSWKGWPILKLASLMPYRGPSTHLLGNCYKISRYMSLYPWRGANSVFRGTANIANTWVWFAKPHLTEKKNAVFFILCERISKHVLITPHVISIMFQCAVFLVGGNFASSGCWLCFHFVAAPFTDIFSNFIYWMWDGGSKRNYALERGTLMPLCIFVLTGWPRPSKKKWPRQPITNKYQKRIQVQNL